MKIVFVSYNYLPEYKTAKDWIDRIRFFTGIMEALAIDNKVCYIGQFGFKGDHEESGVRYRFINPRKYSPFPRELHRMVRAENPDIVCIPGFHFPLQLIQLRWKLGKKVKIICEHHADKPGGRVLRFLQKIADKRIDAYHFSSIENAEPWIAAGIISDRNKCVEMSSGSTGFRNKGKEASRKNLGIAGEPLILWVGRLNQNKDPFTVLRSFKKYVQSNTLARIYMVYQKLAKTDGINEVYDLRRGLESEITLVGEIPYQELEDWYSAADIYVNTSHSEGGSIALLEAMACGCVPLVSAIHSSLSFTGNGSIGLNFQPGNSDELFQQLKRLNSDFIREEGKRAQEYFEKEFSFPAIAGKFNKSCRDLLSK